MILDENGEKWACENCVKGHRVSSCQHRDRPLQHINKKGRPVSQCPHCRGLRKNRSTHIKCECGAQGHSKDGSVDKLSPGSNQGACSCMHGMKCTCALKKEFSDFNGVTKFSASTVSHRRTRSKPEMQVRRPDNNVPKVRNTFHPPMPRQNNASQEYGHPYTIPKQVQENRPYRHAQRSVDSLPLVTYTTSAQQLQPQEASQYLTLPSTTYTSRVVRSEHGSPFLSPQPSSPEFGSQMPTFDVSSPPHLSFMHNAVSSHNPQRYSIHDLSFFGANDVETSSQYTASSPTPFTPEHGPLNWGDFDFNTFNDTNGAGYQSQVAPSEGSIDFAMEHPGLSRSSSGTVSDSMDGHYRQGSFSFGGGAPTITVDSWSHTNDFSESNTDAYSNYAGSVSSYAETPQDYMFPDNASNALSFEAFQAAGFGPGPEQIAGKDFAADFDGVDMSVHATSPLVNMTSANFANDSPWEQSQSPQTYAFTAYDVDNDEYQSHNQLSW